MNTHRYHTCGKTWQVDERDAVVIMSQGKEVTTGYNHSRCWTSALNYAVNNK